MAVTQRLQSWIPVLSLDSNTPPPQHASEGTHFFDELLRPHSAENREGAIRQSTINPLWPSINPSDDQVTANNHRTKKETSENRHASVTVRPVVAKPSSILVLFATDNVGSDVRFDGLACIVRLLPLRPRTDIAVA